MEVYQVPLQISQKSDICEYSLSDSEDNCAISKYGAEKLCFSCSFLEEY